MSGMATSVSANVSNYNARSVLLEVNGLCHQSISKTTNYQIKVPYNRLSQTIQNLSRMGAKVTKVKIVPYGSLVFSSSRTLSDRTEVKKPLVPTNSAQMETKPESVSANSARMATKSESVPAKPHTQVRQR
jgi:hypothetical protein